MTTATAVKGSTQAKAKAKADPQPVSGVLVDEEPVLDLTGFNVKRLILVKTKQNPAGEHYKLSAEGLVKKDQDEGPMLSLSMLEPVRPTISIKSQAHPDGKLYELAVLNDFGVRKAHRLKRDGKEYDALYASDEELSEDQDARLKLLLDRMYAQVFPAPGADQEAKEIAQLLPDMMRSEVVLAFTYAPFAKAIAALKAAAEAEKAQAQESPTTES